MSFPSINSSAILGNPRISVGLPSLVGTNVCNKFGRCKFFATFVAKFLALRMYPLREAKQVSFSGLCRGQGFALKTTYGIRTNKGQKTQLS